MKTDHAYVTYERFAAIYDDFNAANDYEMWLGTLLPKLERLGLRRGRLLDVGCGSGRAFRPMLRRGWQIHGCDISPAMLELARRQGGEEVALSVCDMRDLPVIGSFELILCLNDAINYLLGDGDIERALAGMAANLAPDGLLLFDCNSLATFLGVYTDVEETVENRGDRWTWRGLGRLPGAAPVYEALIEGDGIVPIANRQRHHPAAEVRTALASAGLRPLAILGQQEAEGHVRLVDPADETREPKIVYIAAPI
jgi:SAM-dependent methyltransferase